MHSDRICRSCRSQGQLDFLSLGPTPLTDAYVPPERAGLPERRYPLDVAFCPNCTLVQIPAVVPPAAIFEHYTYFSSFSDTLLSRSQEHVRELIADRGLGPDDLVVEVASNDGYLLRYFVAEGIPVLGIDPARGPADAAEAVGVPTLREFFGIDLANRLRSDGKAADVLIANNVLAHVPDLNGFVEGIATILSDDGVCEIEVPYVRELIEKLEFDTIYHEHLCYFSVSSLERLFSRHGLSIDAVRILPIHGGSLRLTIRQNGELAPSVRSYLDDEAHHGMHGFDYYTTFAERIAQVQRSLRELLHNLHDRGKTIAAYGAAAKGTILLNSAGIGSDLITFVADKSPHKQGKLMPGVGVPIVPPERILLEMPDYVLLLAWNIQEEIAREQRAYLEAGGKFVVPIPSPVEVGKESLETPEMG